MYQRTLHKKAFYPLKAFQEIFPFQKKGKITPSFGERCTKELCKKAFCPLKAFQEIFPFQKKGKITPSFGERCAKELCTKSFSGIFLFSKERCAKEPYLSPEEKQTKELCAKHTDLFSAKLLKILKKLSRKVSLIGAPRQNPR